MRILFYLFAIVVLLFQICPGYAQPPADLGLTAECRSVPGNFCHAGPCPPTFQVSGSCHGGLNCCSKDLAVDPDKESEEKNLAL